MSASPSFPSYSSILTTTTISLLDSASAATFESTLFIDSVASGKGGALTIDDASSTVVISHGSAIADCHGSERGGAVSMLLVDGEGSDLPVITIHDTAIHNCSTSASGGAVYVFGDVTAVIRCAPHRVWRTAASPPLTPASASSSNSSITGNHAGNLGGAAVMLGRAHLKVDGSYIAHNDARTVGGTVPKERNACQHSLSLFL